MNAMSVSQRRETRRTVKLILGARGEAIGRVARKEDNGQLAVALLVVVVDVAVVVVVVVAAVGEEVIIMVVRRSGSRTRRVSRRRRKNRSLRLLEAPGLLSRPRFPRLRLLLLPM
jgi:uncharacterized protein HemY